MKLFLKFCFQTFVFAGTCCNVILALFTVALKSLVAEYKSLKVGSGHRKREWANRMTVLEESWASRRQEIIFSYVVKNERPCSGKCTLCFENDVKVACSSCDSLENQLLCHSCDFQVHEMLPFHKRTSSAGGFKARLSPNIFIGENGEDLVEKSTYLQLINMASMCMKSRKQCALCYWKGFGVLRDS